METLTLPRSTRSVTIARTSDSFSENFLGRRKVKSRNFEFRDFTSITMLASSELVIIWPKPVIDLIIQIIIDREGRKILCARIKSQTPGSLVRAHPALYN